MPWFYFHLRSPEGLEQDDTGLEFADIEAAYLEACYTVPELSAEFSRMKRNPAQYAFEIADTAGSLLMDVPFTEVLDRGRRPVAPSSDRRLREGAAEMARSAHLIRAVAEEHASLKVTLAETKRLLAASKEAVRRSHLMHRW